MNPTRLIREFPVDLNNDLTDFLSELLMTVGFSPIEVIYGKHSNLYCKESLLGIALERVWHIKYLPQISIDGNMLYRELEKHPELLRRVEWVAYQCKLFNQNCFYVSGIGPRTFIISTEAIDSVKQK